MDDLAAARKALRRGRTSDALVYLWNALEPARLAGDASQLRGLAALAARVARDGDEAERQEAARLLAGLHGAVDGAPAVAATERVDAHVSVGEGAMGDEYEVPGEGAEPAAGEGDPEAAGPGRRVAVANLVWLLLVLAVIVLNVIRGVGD